MYAHRISYLGLSPLPITVTTRIAMFLVGDPYKHSFATVTGRGGNPNHIIWWIFPTQLEYHMQPRIAHHIAHLCITSQVSRWIIMQVESLSFENWRGMIPIKQSHVQWGQLKVQRFPQTIHHERWRRYFVDNESIAKRRPSFWWRTHSARNLLQLKGPWLQTT